MTLRGHPESTVPSTPWPDPLPMGQRVVRPILLVAVPDADVQLYPAAPFTRLAARTTADALRIIQQERPRVVVIDWDHDGLDAAEICRTAYAERAPSILITITDTARVPAAIKLGCDAVLLKPFPPNLLAARLGRLFREPAREGFANGAVPDRAGTNRVWPGTACPQCATGGATSFEFASHRRMWYACLACENVWLGRRQE